MDFPPATAALSPTAHVAKGLEFDAVIIPHATANNNRTDIDRGMLYIAAPAPCTAWR